MPPRQPLPQEASVHDNPIIDFMLRRRSTLAAKMAEPAPTDADLDLILAAALRVPDHGKLEPWRIQVLRKPGQKKLAAVYRDSFIKTCPEATNKQIETAEQKLTRAPLLLVVSCKPNLEKIAKVPLIEQASSAAAVCSHILIAAGALGYAAQWLTGDPAYDPAVKNALGIDADNNITGLLFLGSVIDAPLERPRPERAQIVSDWNGDDA